MLLSIIIVSYEVKHFLEQCLFSVNAAIRQLENDIPSAEVEVIVVDNASTDGTVEYLCRLFPSINFIPNKSNAGFSRANNQAIEKATGKYILFLNPDTIIPENILTDCISFLQSRSSVGALGVRMVDGSGNFLVESKRGFPTAWRSFCKLSGLSSLFPNSKSFAGYNLGHIKEDAAIPIEVLAGAFMIVRKQVLDITGGFDERFFMYAEDIDLSKRIKDAGFENYYLGNCTILHFKGESTKRDRVYVKRFYEAMNLYVKKHYTGFGSRLSVGVMKAAIGLRSMFAIAQIGDASGSVHSIEKARFDGDEESITLLREELNGLVEDDSAERVILCQGKNFTFAALIEVIQKLPKASKPMIHASGSHSIVGSSDKNTQGLVKTLTSA